MFISPAPNVTLSHKWVLDQILNDSTALSKGLPWWLSDESICLKCRRPGFDPWVGKIPWKRSLQPTPVFLTGESPWTEEPGGYSPQWGVKELDTTEQLILLTTCLLSYWAFSFAPGHGVSFFGIS